MCGLVGSFFMFFLAGCSGISGSNSEFSLNEFNARVAVNDNGKNYECEIKHSPQGVEHVKFLKPEALNGLSIMCEDSEYKISKKDLCAKYNSNPLDLNSAIFKIFSILKSMNNPENFKLISKSNDKMIYEGSANGEKYEFTTDKSENLLTITVTDKKIFLKVI